MKKIDLNEEPEKIRNLLENDWVYVKDRGAIRKEFIFSDFVEAFGWMCKAAIIAEKLNHHPEWFNVFKRVEVTLTTHDLNGLSDLDITLASKLDSLA